MRADINDKELKRIEDLIRKAGDIILGYWEKTEGAARPQVEIKADGSPVSDADLKASELLVSGLQELYPHDGIVSEELKVDADVYKKDRVWIIDPLDGTKSFLQGNDDFSILVGLCEKGVPVFGVMYFPGRGQYVLGQQGRGAFLNGERLKVSGSKVIREHSLYVRRVKLEGDNRVYPRWMDSGAAFLNICSGKFDGMLMKIVTHREWDLVAPAAILKESGGAISDGEGKTLVFDKPGLDIDYLVASNGEVHQEILKILT